MARKRKLGKGDAKRPRTEFHPSGKKQPVTVVEAGGKKPRIAHEPVDPNSAVVWELKHLDPLFADWKTDAKIGDVRRLLDRLQNIEKLGWRGLAQQKFHKRTDHFIPPAQLCSDAQKRLAKLELDDVDELLSIHVTGRKRAWAVRVGSSSIARLLWWDPDHKVYPVSKRNT